MPQLLLQGFPDGAIKIGPVVSLLKKESKLTYFVGSDNFYSHPVSEIASHRFIIATLVANGHVRACEVESSELNIPHRTLMNWTKQLEERGPGSFFMNRSTRGGSVITPAKAAECALLFDKGLSIPGTARNLNIKESTLRKALSSLRVVRGKTVGSATNNSATDITTKSERSRLDALAAEGMGTACTRACDRMAAAMGLIDSVSARFEHSVDVEMGGVLVGLPALCANGLLSGLNRYLSLPKGFYSAMHILLLLGFMALARIRRPEALRHVPPGEAGKIIGLDRAPEVRTVRQKIGIMAETGMPAEWMRDLSRRWMVSNPDDAGYLYIDGHVRVYSGSSANLPRRYVSRDKLCLKGTTDYWVNDALGRPFFVVSKSVTDGLAATLIKDIVPELLKSVPNQPTDTELIADPQQARFVMIFDREGSTHSLLSNLWEHRIGAITYRKAVKDKWPNEEFIETEVPMPGGEVTHMKLASKETRLSGCDGSMPVVEVRRLTETGHQTAIITTSRQLNSAVIAGRMFSRWCQENYFGYMMEHYDIDGLVQYGDEELPGTLQVINPSWRELDKKVRTQQSAIRKLYSKMAEDSLSYDGKNIPFRADQVENIQRLESDLKELKENRRKIPRKVTIASLPENERPQQLLPLRKILTDTIKMIAYRAETALVVLLRKHLAKEDEARALIREIFVSSADIEPDEKEKTLTVKIHRMACPAHDKAASALLEELTSLSFCHPETGLRMIYKLA
jgi:hypothetical protein